MMAAKKILILGASGIIGKHLFDFLKNQEKEVIGTYNLNKKPELIPFNIINSSIENLPLKDVKYTVICSAVAKMDECKRDVDYSYKVNVEGTKRIIIGLSKRGIIPIFISGAAVFDGISGNYKEDDKKNPQTVYGKHKQEIEDYITSTIKDYLIIRPGKVFGVEEGEGGGLFADWLLKYRKGEQIFCAYDETLCPHYTEDVARGIYVLMDKDAKGVYNTNPNQHYNRFELATDFFDYLKIKDAKIIRCSIDDFPFLEKRTKRNHLNSSKFINELNFKFTPLKTCYEMIKQNIEYHSEI